MIVTFCVWFLVFGLALFFGGVAVDIMESDDMPLERTGPVRLPLMTAAQALDHAWLLDQRHTDAEVQALRYSLDETGPLQRIVLPHPVADKAAA